MASCLTLALPTATLWISWCSSKSLRSLAAILQARPVGILIMHDEKGRDEKILSVPVRDPRFAEIHELDDVPPHLLKEIENFFATYKELEGKQTMTLGWSDRLVAESTIDEARSALSRS
jgi:inorganic pyrophosphatase